MPSQIVKLMFDGELQECLVTTDASGEITCLARNHRFLKFPKDCDLVEEAKKHNEANSSVPVLATVVEAQEAERNAWLSGEDVGAEEIVLEK